MWEDLWLILLGAGTGIVGVIIGAGGGFILGPILLVVTDIDPQAVVGTTLALVAVNSLSGAVAYLRLRMVDLRSGILFALAGIPGSILAPFALVAVGGRVFMVLFGLLLLGLGAFIVTRRQGEASPLPSNAGAEASGRGHRRIATASGHVFEYHFSEPLAVLVNFLLGFVASFFGIGAGILRTPLLVYGFRFPVRIAVATSVFSLVFIAVAGTATHLYLGHFAPWAFVWAGVGVLVGGQIGARLATRVRGPWIMRILALLLLLLGARLMAQGLVG